MASSSAAVRRLPVGLLGVQMKMAFVRGVTKEPSAVTSGVHRVPAASTRSGHGTMVAPSVSSSPGACM
jgi:hypothetical protein